MAGEISVLFIGCGNMGAALAAGYAFAHPEARVLAIDHEPERARALLPAGAPVTVYRNMDDLAGVKPALVIIALKPQVFEQALAELRPLCAGALVISIAAGVVCQRLAGLLGGHRRIVRAMPNLPVVAGQGMTTLFGDGLEPADRELASQIFAAVGKVAWLDDENAIDLATAVAGSGPAYFFAFVEHLTAAGVAAGLSSELAATLARQTCIGSAALLNRDTRSATSLKQAVCSPGGTTSAGLAAMEISEGLAPLVAAGVAAAYRRARELADA